jgi:hypothetical protein
VEGGVIHFRHFYVLPVNRADSLPEPKVITEPLAWSTRKLTLFAFYLLANLGGAFLIFCFSHSIVQLARLEQRDYYDGVDGITFICNAAPVFLFCGFINAFWVIKVFIDIFKRRDFRALIALCIVFAVWAADFLAMRLDARLPT